MWLSGNIIIELRNLSKTRGLDRDLVYLLQLAKKHRLTRSTLYSAMVAARDRGKSKHGKFSIQLRDSGDESSVYMFSYESKPLSQAKIPNASIDKLRRLPEEFAEFNREEEDNYANSVGGERPISSLKFGLKGVNLTAHVVKKSEVRAVTSKDGNPLLVCSFTLSDGTGEIPLVIWNSQIQTIAEGDLVKVQNARVGSFRGEKQLALDRKKGAVKVLESTARPMLKVAN